MKLLNRRNFQPEEGEWLELPTGRVCQRLNVTLEQKSLSDTDTQASLQEIQFCWVTAGQSGC